MVCRPCLSEETSPKDCSALSRESRRLARASCRETGRQARRCFRYFCNSIGRMRTQVSLLTRCTMTRSPARIKRDLLLQPATSLEEQAPMSDVLAAADSMLQSCWISSLQSSICKKASLPDAQVDGLMRLTCDLKPLVALELPKAVRLLNFSGRSVLLARDTPA